MPIYCLFVNLIHIYISIKKWGQIRNHNLNLARSKRLEGKYMFRIKCMVLSFLIVQITLAQHKDYFFKEGKPFSPAINKSQFETELNSNKNYMAKSNQYNDGFLIASSPNIKMNTSTDDSIKFYIKFDHYCFFLELFDGATWINSSENIIWNDGKTFATITIPTGIYQIFTYSQFDTKDFFVIKENISILQSDTLEIYYQSDAKNSVTLRNLDENGNILPVIQEYYLTPLEIYFSMFDAKLTFWGFTFFDINCSDLSENMIFSVGLSRSDFGTSHKNYVINHTPIIGLTQDIVLENNPDDFIEHDVKILCSQTDDSVYIGSADCMRFVGDELWGFGAATLINEKTWGGKLFTTPFNSQYTGFCTSLFLANLDNSIRFYTSPIQTENGLTFPYHIAGINNAPPNTVFIPSNYPIELGYTTNYCNSFLANSLNYVYLQYYYLGLFNENIVRDLSFSGYRLYNNNDSLISAGTLETFPTINVLPNEYHLLTKNKNFTIASEPAEINTIQNFDIRKVDPNPPYLTSLAITDLNGISKRLFTTNENAKITFSAFDADGNFNNFLIDSTKLFVRTIENPFWQNIPLTYINFDIRVGFLYEADLSYLTNYDSASVDLNICIQDIERNSTEVYFEPAFGVGKYGTITEITNNNPVNYSNNLSNFPNPFNPSTTIRYEIKTQSKITLKVFDVLGKEIATLVDETKLPGVYDVKFTMDMSLSSGIYFYQLKAGDFIQTKKMIYLK